MSQRDDSQPPAASEDGTERSNAVSARRLTGPGSLEREKEAVFGRYWVYVGHADSIPEPGQFFTRNVGDRQLIVVRGHDDEVKAFDNVCAHRGSKMVEDTPMTDPGGGGRIQCPYHLWTYDLDGDLRSTPKSFEDASLNPDLDSGEVQEFDCEANGLNDVRVDTVGPLVFANLGDDPPSLAEQVGAAADRLESLPLEEYEHGRRIVSEVECNWKLFAAVHFDGSEERDADGTLAVDDHGWTVERAADGDGSEDRRPDGLEAQFHYCWPNVAIDVYEDVDGYATVALDPVGPDRVQLIADYYFRDGDLSEAERELVRTTRQRRAEDAERAERRRTGLEGGASDRLGSNDRTGAELRRLAQEADDA
ncbi:aromatic ring-hydroxylating oxygenase subunit alpha [Natronococcus jeotgali]|uniref:Rieske (2Fe-2S) iron-sulfur domain-containing protein n=1 Tax=Natronococcus jeotgali DSM 18795 TaxID=1227498 RepID=L9X2K6_9EURY|nr:aromatic ring-hydroxylating dioxygenase subunit alpha [Natronococcus jeotgali]ELY55701.1 Rieske (2Fe-2S) iron-sulfur domain-containing protein [Natronococcus jeotgali DSM 18795]